jgi:hypothetical protein
MHRFAVLFDFVFSAVRREIFLKFALVTFDIGTALCERNEYGECELRRM